MLRARDFHAALQTIDQMLLSHPRDCRLLSLKGMALHGLVRRDEALKAYLGALRYCPRDLPSLEGAAEIEYSLKSPDALDLLLRVLQLRPDDATTHGMLAVTYRSRGDCGTALTHFRASESLFPSHPQLQAAFAACLSASGDYKNAAANFRQMLTINPDDTTRFNLAVTLWHLHDLQGALTVLEPILDRADNGEALALGANIAEQAGDTPRAVQLLRSAILLEPRQVDNYLDFAIIAFNTSSFQVGIDMVNAGLTQVPNSAELYIARGVLEVQMSQFDQAVADFDHAHQLDPQRSLTMDALGMLQTQKHNSSGSLEMFQKQIALHPDDGFLQYLYAEALSESGTDEKTTKEAIAAAEKSIAADSSYQPCRDLLAMLYRRANLPARAIEAAQMALRNNPDDETALYQELLAERQLGHTEQVHKLAQRFAETRKRNALRQQSVNRFALQEASPNADDH